MDELTTNPATGKPYTYLIEFRGPLATERGFESIEHALMYLTDLTTGELTTSAEGNGITEVLDGGEPFALIVVDDSEGAAS